MDSWAEHCLIAGPKAHVHAVFPATQLFGDTVDIAAETKLVFQVLTIKRGIRRRDVARKQRARW